MLHSTCVDTKRANLGMKRSQAIYQCHFKILVLLLLKILNPYRLLLLQNPVDLLVKYIYLLSCDLYFFLYIFTDIHEPWYLRRADWYANSDRGITLLKLPISMVIIGHSVREFCTDKYECIEYVLDMQKDHLMENRYVDIGPNFLVGGEGYVFEGRGANVLGEMVKYYNYKSISIMFLGNYVYDKPNLAMFDNLSVLLKELVNKRVLTTDYKLYGQCQVIGAIVQPGPNVMDKLHLFDHWDPTNRSACMSP